MKQCRGQMSMFSAEASLDLASRSVLPGSEEARRMTVISGRKCCELYKNSGPLGLLVRMLLGSSIWRSTRCTLTWKTKVIPSKRLLFRLVPLTPRTGETGASLWPTVTTNSVSQRTKRYKQGGLPLAMVVKMWSTPTATDSKGSGAAGTKAAEHDLMFYPTPTTGAGLCGGTGNYLQLKKLADAGQITEEERKSMSQGNGGQLNPDWVEWLQGFPIGWTEV